MTAFELSSIGIAICALVFSIYQGWLLKKHNKLSCRPLVSSHVSKDKEGEWMFVSYFLQNCGLGPAIIKNIELYWEKEKVDSENPVKAIVEKAFGDRYDYKIIKTGWLNEDFPFSEKDRFLLGFIKFENWIDQYEDDIDQTIDKMSIRVEYESIYGDRNIFDSEDYNR